MPPPGAEQTVRRAPSSPAGPTLHVGIDVGGTFTDFVAFDPSNASVRVIKAPSTPPDFHLAVIGAFKQAAEAFPGRSIDVVHGTTVATNALLQRSGEPVAFVTTEGFRDMLLIGRQNRPRLYALRVERPKPLTPEENWFTLRERVDSRGEVVEPLDPAEVDRLVETIHARGIRHVAVCLLFSFLYPGHERLVAERCGRAGLTVSLSCDVLPEFREYERASTTVINAALRPTVEGYLTRLQAGLATSGASHRLRILHSAGGTLAVAEAAGSAARLVLSGPAGGVSGAAFMASAAGIKNVITYDMGGTSTDVATVVEGQPQSTTSSMIDGLPIGLPTFDIATVGAGGGSVAWIDTGGALRVGPRSAGAAPGPACYGRGGAEPTVTDANLALGRILPDEFANGTVRVDPGLARWAIEPLAARIGLSVEQAALGILRVAEQSMSRAIRSVTSRRGHDPRLFALVSFGGAGGLHACALADNLEVPRVLVPPFCGVLSALGMVVAPPSVDVSKTVLHLGEGLDDHRLVAEFGNLSYLAAERLAIEQTASIQAFADVRFKGQSHELTVNVDRPDRERIETAFREAYVRRYGRLPQNRAVEIVNLRLRRIGHRPPFVLPRIARATDSGSPRTTNLIDADGQRVAAAIVKRADLVDTTAPAPMLLIDPEATTFAPAGWSASGRSDGIVTLERNEG